MMEEVQRREVTDNASGQADEAGDQQRIGAQLEIGEPLMPIDQAERREIDDAQRVGQPNQEEEGINRKRSWPVQLDEDGLNPAAACRPPPGHQSARRGASGGPT